MVAFADLDFAHPASRIRINNTGAAWLCSDGDGNKWVEKRYAALLPRAVKDLLYCYHAINCYKGMERFREIGKIANPRGIIDKKSTSSIVDPMTRLKKELYYGELFPNLGVPVPESVVDFDARVMYHEFIEGKNGLECYVEGDLLAAQLMGRAEKLVHDADVAFLDSKLDKFLVKEGTQTVFCIDREMSYSLEEFSADKRKERKAMDLAVTLGFPLFFDNIIRRKHGGKPYQRNYRTFFKAFLHSYADDREGREVIALADGRGLKMFTHLLNVIPMFPSRLIVAREVIRDAARQVV